MLNNGLENHFRFTGYEHDPETGDYYADYREQSPSLGRFFSPDPVLGDPANPQSLNRYAYVLNNPTNLIDPFGLDSSVCTGNRCDVVGDIGVGWVSIGGGFGGGGGAMGLELSGPEREGSEGGGDGIVQIPLKPLDCSLTPSQPSAPPNASVGANMQLGRNQANNAASMAMNATPGATGPGTGGAAAGASITTTAWLYSQFKTGGPQDYKTNVGPQFVDFGNFNYGAVCGSTGSSLRYCQSAAGIGLIGRVLRRDVLYELGMGNHYKYTGAGVPFLVPPFGDQPGDSSLIAYGYAYQQWARQCRNGK